jgi:hypothetical protein
MREVFFILIVVGLLLAFTAFRYRKQLLGVYQVWQMLKQAGAQGRKSREEINTANETETGPLVNCAKCGTWVPESRAIKLGARMFYCSTACVERSATAA